MRTNLDMDLILQRLEKAVTTGTITAIVPEDLEAEAHLTLWNETDPQELTLLKLLPSTDATQIDHQYTRVNSYGGGRKNSGFFGERSLPPETTFGNERVHANIKLMGEIGPTFLLAALEKTQRGLGTTGAQNMERIALRLNVLWKKCRNLYYSDTRTTRSSLRFKGLFQLIEEGTDKNATGFSGVAGKGSPYGSHVIDMEGQPLSMATLREKWAYGLTLFGPPTVLLMDPLSRGDLEGSMDAAQRLAVPTTMSPLVFGQTIAGLRTQGGNLWFHTDNTLSPIHSRGQYTDPDTEDYPSGLPTIVSATPGAVGGSRTSHWDSSSAGSIFYVVTEVVDEVEGYGVRSPASTSAFLTVAAGQEVALVLRPSSPEVEAFRIYRGRSEDGESEITDAWFIYEVANAAGGSTTTTYDDNDWRPRTSMAFALNIVSNSAIALQANANGTAASYESARARSAEFLTQPDNPRNTVAVANLGPAMGILALASVLAEVDRPLIYSACTPEMRNPFQNWVFKNIGRA